MFRLVMVTSVRAQSVGENLEALLLTLSPELLQKFSFVFVYLYCQYFHSVGSCMPAQPMPAFIM